MNFRQIIWFCLLLSCTSLSAQQKQKENTTINIPGIGKELPCSFEYDYILADSTRTQDGILKINGSRNEGDVKENFTLQGYATKGLLNGSVNSSYSLEGKMNDEKHYISFIYSAGFRTGLPHGEIKINSFGQKSSAYDIKMNFIDGVLAGDFKFNAFLKQETSISGAFTNDGKMNGDWKFWYYDLRTKKDDKITLTLSNGVKTAGEGYTKELEQMAKEYAAGKTPAQKLNEKGIDIYTRKEFAIEQAISDAVRNRFIPFDALAAMDLSKVSVSYEYLDYFPSIDADGFALLLQEIEDNNGYVLPDADVFGISQDSRNKRSYKSFDTTFSEHINHANWNENGLCNVYFTEKQQHELNKKLEEAQTKWKTGAVAICRSNYELLIEQQLLNKTAAEISALMTSAIKRGYKVDNKPTAERYQKHAPIIKFENIEIGAPVDSTAIYKLTSRINVQNADSLGYRTYEWYVNIRSTDPADIYNDLNDSFTTDNFARIRNDYDEINGLIGAIDKNNKEFESAATAAAHNPMAGYSAYIKNSKAIDTADLPGTTERLKQILEFQKEFENWLNKSIVIKETDNQIRESAQKHKDIITGYDDYLKKTDISWTPANSLENLIKLEETQKDVLKFIKASCEVASNDKSIRKNGSKYNDLVKGYRKYIKATDIKWTIGADLSHLDTILDIQSRTLAFIQKRDTISIKDKAINSHRESLEKLTDAYGAYIKGADFNWDTDVNPHKLDSIILIQDKTLKFIDLRHQIVEAHKKLLETGKRYKPIIDSYKSYIENVDVAWTADVDTSKLESILKIQESCKSLFLHSDIKKTNKAVRKGNIKDISVIIERFLK